MSSCFLFKVLVVAAVIIGLFACGGRTELYEGETDVGAEAGMTPPRDAGRDTDVVDAGCVGCGTDASDDSSSDGGSDGSDASALPLTACLGDGSALVVVDPGDSFFTQSLHDFTWTARLSPPNYLMIEVGQTTPYHDWSFVFAISSDAGALAVGSYDNAAFPPATDMSEITIAADGLGCDETTGSFQIDALDVDDGGAVRTFAGTFAQQCPMLEGGALSFTGCVYLTE